MIHEWTRRAPGSGHQILKFRSQTVDSAAQLLQVSFIYDEVAPDGVVRRTAIPFQLRYFFPRETTLLLEKCGFEVEAVYGSYELDPFESGSEKMIVLAAPTGRPFGWHGDPEPDRP